MQAFFMLFVSLKVGMQLDNIRFREGQPFNLLSTGKLGGGGNCFYQGIIMHELMHAIGNMIS